MCWSKNNLAGESVILPQMGNGSEERPHNKEATGYSIRPIYTLGILKLTSIPF